jgi:hypothetical protein
MTRLARTLVIAASALLALPGLAAAQGTLSGEVFSDVFGEGDLVITSASCNPTGTSTFSFLATGPATGPYPGTYEETGTVTIGPQTPGLATAVLSFTASFTIDSAVGDVTGTKSFTGPSDPVAAQDGTCLDASSLGTTRSMNLDSAGVTYDATILTADGTFADHGDADVNVLEQTLDDVLVSSAFREEFFSGLPEPEQENTRPGLGCGDVIHVHERESECRRLR